MFKVSTIYLDAEARHADIQHGTVNRGQLGEPELIKLLENFRAIEAVETIDTDPQIVVSGHGCKLTIRTNRKRLFVYNAENMNEAAIEMSSAEIWRRLSKVEPAPTAAEADQFYLADAPSRIGLAYVLFAAAVLINVYTVYSLFSGGPTVDDKSDITLVHDAHEASRQQQLVAGTYATGRERGDRILIIRADGSLQNSEIGAPGNPPPKTGTYHVGMRDQKLCLSVDGGSVIDVIDHDTVMYYRDTYKRAEQARN